MATRKKDNTPKSKGGWTDEASGSLSHNPFAALGPAKNPRTPTTNATPPTPNAPRPKPPTTPTTPTPPSDPSTPPRRAVVRAERKGRGGKTVTIVSHLALDAATLDTWCRDLRKHLGCGGAVEVDTIVVQGDHRDRAAAWLQARGVLKVTTS